VSILAIDIGSTCFRAALIDERGELASRLVSLPAPAESGPNEVSEVDPAAWWHCLCRAVEDLEGGTDGALGRVDAIAITGVTRTQIFLDRRGIPLAPAMTWRDTRAGTVAGEIAARWPEHPEAGAINAFHPLARLAWLQRHDPERSRALATVLEPKDYLNFRLTGVRATDPISSARLLAAATEDPKGEDLLSRLDLRKGIIPQVLEPTDVLGHSAAGLPGALGRLAGRPVVTMANDTWASVVGIGALRDGFAYNLSGTTEVFGLISTKAAHAEGLLSLAWREGLHQLGGPSQNGADTVAWARDLLSSTHADVSFAGRFDELLRQSRFEQPLIFLPYLRGERTPHWDPLLRGAFIGLHRRHGPADCAYAVLEGVAYLNRAVLERAEAAIGHKACEIRFGGGGARSRLWAQIKADICERPVVVTAAAEPGLLGAAITALVALKTMPSLAAGQQSLVRVVERFAPSPAARDRYRQLYRLFRRAEDALAPISRALAPVRL
jgi:xylulokinase